MRQERPDRTPVDVADDGQVYDPRYMRPCEHYRDADNGGPGFCWATPTKLYGKGVCCRDHTPAALAGRPENKPDPALSLTGIRAAAGAPGAVPPPPASASRVHDDRAVASGKRRSSPGGYREARARLEEANR